MNTPLIWCSNLPEIKLLLVGGGGISADFYSPLVAHRRCQSLQLRDPRPSRCFMRLNDPISVLLLHLKVQDKVQTVRVQSETLAISESHPSNPLHVNHFPGSSRNNSSLTFCFELYARICAHHGWNAHSEWMCSAKAMMPHVSIYKLW